MIWVGGGGGCAERREVDGVVLDGMEGCILWGDETNPVLCIYSAAVHQQPTGKIDIYIRIPCRRMKERKNKVLFFFTCRQTHFVEGVDYDVFDGAH